MWAIIAIRTQPPEQAEAAVLRALASARAAGSSRHIGDGLQNVAIIQAQLGQLVEARALLLDAIQIHQQEEMLGSEAHALYNLSSIERSLGDCAGALSAALNGAALARLSEQHRTEALCLLLAGRIYSESRCPAEAEQYAQRALGIAETLGSAPLAARCQYILAEQALRCEDLDGAAQHLAAIVDEPSIRADHELYSAVLLLRARVMMQRGQLAAAEDAITQARALVLTPAHATPLLLTHAALLLAQDDPDSAEALLSSYTRHPSQKAPSADEAEIAALRSEAAAARGDNHEALRLLRESIALQRQAEHAKTALRLQLHRAVESLDEVHRQLATLRAQNHELRSLVERLHATTVERGLQVRALSHDLRSPITVILLNMDLLQEELGPTDPSITELLENTQQAIDRIQEDLSRALQRSRSTRLGLVEVSLDRLLHNLAETYQLKAQWKEQTLREELAEQTVNADPWLLRHAVSNLLSNALKYTPQGGQITIRCGSAADGGPYLEVEDTGPGLTDADLASIFLPYKTGSARPTDDEDSVGLGLNLARQFAESCGAVLAAGSGASGGARFTISWAPQAHKG